MGFKFKIRIDHRVRVQLHTSGHGRQRKNIPTYPRLGKLRPKTPTNLGTKTLGFRFRFSQHQSIDHPKLGPLTSICKKILNTNPYEPMNPKKFIHITMFHGFFLMFSATKPDPLNSGTANGRSSARSSPPCRCRSCPTRSAWMTCPSQLASRCAGSWSTTGAVTFHDRMLVVGWDWKTLGNWWEGNSNIGEIMEYVKSLSHGFLRGALILRGMGFHD